MADSHARFVGRVVDALRDGTFVKLTLASPTDEAGTLRRVLGRRVELRAGAHLQLTFRHPTRDEVDNVAVDDVERRIAALLGSVVRSANLFTTGGDHQLQWRRDAWVLSRSRASHASVPATTHDRTKQRAVDLDPRWMEGLGVLASGGKIRRGMEAKHRQILRFVEIFDHALREIVAEGQKVRLVDMGCGKGFLTFAAWQWLEARDAVGAVIGVERRSKLVAKARAVAEEHELEGLTFVAGDIADAPLDEVDVVVALHACDTATDDALGRAVASGARVVLAAPCCHQELRPQLEGPPELGEVLRHGILLTRTAEMVTDALRAALLEARGYRTRIFEFVDADHTDKNLMLAAHRRPGEVEGDRLEAPRRLAATFGIAHQRLADRLDYPLGVTAG